MKKDLMREKRESLEKFIREQMIGPNGCNGKYEYLAQEEDGNTGELINTTPGSIYTTAILFPKKKQCEVTDIIDDEEDQIDASVIQITGDDDANDEDKYSLSNNYPNKIGLSFCLASEAILRDLEVSISGRYYTKVSGPARKNVQVVVDHDLVDSFSKFYDSLTEEMRGYFSYENARLRIGDISKIDKPYSTIKELLDSINKQCVEKLVEEQTKDNDGKGQFLSTYREQLFRLFKNNPEERDKLENWILQVELYETFLSYFYDLLDLYNTKAYGFWLCRRCDDVRLDLSSVDYSADETDRYTHKIENVFKTDDLHLCAWIQVVRNSQNASDKNLYVKLLLENETEFEETKKNHLTIVNEEVNKRCFFGTRIDVHSEHLIPYHTTSLDLDHDTEKVKLDYLYRDIKDYALGHFCSVDWPKSGEVKHIWTEFLPTYETPDVEPIPRKKYDDYIDGKPAPYLENNQNLQFGWLSIYSTATDDDVRNGLMKFVECYEDWIKTTGEHIDDDQAKENLSKCKSDLERMVANIEGILNDEANMLSFRLMNAAMFMQLWHKNPDHQKSIRNTTITNDFYSTIYAKTTEQPAWRPFQLAFILLNLDGIIRHPKDDGWKRRNEYVDLVWFPTGGGKTEAYLGIIAMSIINRRRNYDSQGYGVTAIMRYTLRLLTAQQFQRALNLIMALEQIRRFGIVEYKLGAEPISIGLYVGEASLPNSREKLREEVGKWANGQNSKIPLGKCPWCGGDLIYDRDRFACAGSADSCSFKYTLGGIPVCLCDEDIYDTPPTLLFGTVDKFAKLAYDVATSPHKDSRRLLGKRQRGTDCLPPDLIIQDELHLLLGPLGSATAMFECAIDQLCTKNEVRPKIISSTATTRNTGLQIRALYDREVNIFPKNGVSYDDSFFAFYNRKKNEKGEVEFVSKRKYIGIMPTGRTQMTTQMRLAAILLVHRAIFENDHSNDPNFDHVADYYYSVISYFNSLKELGKTDAQFYTEYTKYVRRLFKRVMRHGKMLDCYYALNEMKEVELSGRIQGDEINKKFDEVGRTWTKENRMNESLTPPDFIMATNMISVGLDVSRFNTIIMNSMPRNIAEYIQASSRVARDNIGLVLTLHNPFRARDLSHYEKFRETHEKLYYYVEPISITPFSQKSVDKYFPLYLATIVRHTYDAIANCQSANRLDDNLKNKILAEVTKYFEEKYSRISKLDGLEKGLLNEKQKNYIIDFSKILLEEWEDRKARVNDFDYYKNKNRDAEYLFLSPSEYDEVKSGRLWIVPQSLRTVEPEAVLQLNDKIYEN